MTTLTEDIQTKMPFISVILYGNVEYVGIIINQDQNVVSFYDMNIIRNAAATTEILELGEIWYWESNRLLPINIFLRKEMKQFQYAIKTFISKEVTILLGPTVSISNMSAKRVKRRTVQLVKTPKP
jgi:hypothetical protein